MFIIKQRVGFLGVLILVLFLQGCGQKGPLFSPQNSDKKEEVAKNPGMNTQ